MWDEITHYQTWDVPHWEHGLLISEVLSLIVFWNHQDTRYLLNIIFIFDRCRSSLAAVEPVKYECDSKNTMGTFARRNIKKKSSVNSKPSHSVSRKLADMALALNYTEVGSVSYNFSYLGHSKVKLWCEMQIYIHVCTQIFNTHTLTRATQRPLKPKVTHTTITHLSRRICTRMFWTRQTGLLGVFVCVNRTG